MNLSAFSVDQNTHHMTTKFKIYKKRIKISLNKNNITRTNHPTHQGTKYKKLFNNKLFYISIDELLFDYTV
jgi:hypothetical protein